MSQNPSEPPREPAKRPAHHARRAVTHHAAHRKRLQAQAEAHYQQAPREQK